MRERQRGREAERQREITLLGHDEENRLPCRAAPPAPRARSVCICPRRRSRLWSSGKAAAELWRHLLLHGGVGPGVRGVVVVFVTLVPPPLSDLAALVSEGSFHCVHPQVLIRSANRLSECHGGGSEQGRSQDETLSGASHLSPELRTQVRSAVTTSKRVVEGGHVCFEVCVPL